MFFYPADTFHFHAFGCHLGSQLGSLWQKCDPDRCCPNSHKSRSCFFTQQTFPMFIPLAVTCGPQLGSLLQKCDPDRCDQNSHKNCLCFFTHQTFSIFSPLAVAWCPNLDPCGKSVVLTVTIKIHMKVVYVFLPSRQFPFSYLWLSLGVPAWILVAKV
jgi:hypothetical protein